MARQRLDKGSTLAKRARIGAAIRQLRLDRGWSVKDLGERVGVVPSQVSRWEHGSRAPYFDKLADVAKVFGVPVESITGDDPQDAALFVSVPVSGTIGRKTMGADGSARRLAKADEHVAVDAAIAARWRGDRPGKLALWRCMTSHLDGFERGDLLAFVESEVADSGQGVICSVPKIGLWFATASEAGPLVLPTGEIVRGKILAVLRGLIR